MKLKDLSTKYDFKQVEIGKYDKWLSEGYFQAGDNTKKPYTIVIPPPNITGKLHLGHVWDTTLQDIIIRRKRMMGFDVLYLPGMDHASIATQAKIEAKLKEQGISRYDLGREKFLEVSWKWKEEYAKLIREQWAVIGLSLDYSRERFTLDEGLNQAVNEVFVRMYQDKLIYRGEKIINWDVQSCTALSNIEVEYKDIEGAYYHFIYPFVDEAGGLEIVTTRPETMFGDVALMVHPQDKRYQRYVGKKVYIPNTKRAIPIIADDYVDMSFGTGVVKVTPAHDPNDFEVGLRHQLERPLCMTEDGKMNELAGVYQGMERFACRKEVVKDLEQCGLCPSIEKMFHAVGHSERTGVIVEPRLSKQWFVHMEPLAKLIIDQQQTEQKINFIPARFEQTFLNWMENIQDWCISRQLWWGHRIPAWYKGDEIYVGLTPPQETGWQQDEDALDTWFSSALWPFSTLGWPNDTNDYQRYFPTDALVTGYDIIFFWVARMAFQSKYLTNQRPFRDVLIHGIIRDELGRKVSKSLGNGVDMMDAVDQYGIDSLRYFLTTSSSPGQDIRYSNEKMEAAWNYINKIWNIARYIGLTFDQQGFQDAAIQMEYLSEIDKWILATLNRIIDSTNENFEKYEFGEVAKAIYKFVWDDFASWYLEMTKVVFGGEDKNVKRNTCAILNYILETILKLLNPFMPFFTEDIYQKQYKGSITIASWPQSNPLYYFEDTNRVYVVYEIITMLRNLRSVRNIGYHHPIEVFVQTRDENLKQFIIQHQDYIHKFTNLASFHVSIDEIDSRSSIVEVLTHATVIVPLKSLVNIDDERKKLEGNRQKMLQEIDRCEQMLNNPSFILKAPTTKVDAEKQKLSEYKQQLSDIEKLLSEL